MQKTNIMFPYQNKVVFDVFIVMHIIIVMHLTSAALTNITKEKLKKLVQEKFLK